MTTLTKELVVQTEDRLLAAMIAHDITILDALLHDDLLFLTPDGQTITKAMDLEAYRSGAMVIEKIERTMEGINIIDDTAVVTLVLDTKGAMLDQPIEGRFKYIMVWKLINGQMRVVGGGCVGVVS
ncbi:MAG TPA: nuclear transport factor 2 family protein [Bacteroidia bacterium]|nr:nuclear transport factor 2 family protein [Bacteroidia bacterium]